MSVIETTLSVNFGSRKGSLSTVGYTLYDKTKAIVQARTTTGVTELIDDTGIYQVLVSISSAFIGSIVWDTGEATKLYAIEDLDFRKFTYQSSVIVGGGPLKGVWTEKEKKKLFKDMRELLKAVKGIKIKDNTSILETIESKVKEANDRGAVNYKFINESLNLMRAEAKKGDAVKTLQEGIELLSKGMVAIIENKEVENVVKEVNDYVEAQTT